MGTGFVVRGGVVTASHVVASCPPGATFAFGRNLYGTVTLYDPAHDLALLAFKGTGFAPPALRLESASAHAGEPLVVVSAPDGYASLSITNGTVTATRQRRQLASADGKFHETLPDAIEVTALGVGPGFSGSPAIDMRGNVVGVLIGSLDTDISLSPVKDLPTGS